MNIDSSKIHKNVNKHYGWLELVFWAFGTVFVSPTKPMTTKLKAMITMKAIRNLKNVESNICGYYSIFLKATQLEMKQSGQSAEKAARRCCDRYRIDRFRDRCGLRYCIVY